MEINIQQLNLACKTIQIEMVLNFYVTYNNMIARNIIEKIDIDIKILTEKIVFCG